MTGMTGGQHTIDPHQGLAPRVYMFAPLSEMLIRLATGWDLDGYLPGHHGEYSVLMTKKDDDDELTGV